MTKEVAEASGRITGYVHEIALLGAPDRWRLLAEGEAAPLGEGVFWIATPEGPKALYCAGDSEMVGPALWSEVKTDDPVGLADSAFRKESGLTPLVDKIHILGASVFLLCMMIDSLLSGSWDLLAGCLLILGLGLGMVAMALRGALDWPDEARRLPDTIGFAETALPFPCAHPDPGVPGAWRAGTASAARAKSRREFRMAGLVIATMTAASAAALLADHPLWLALTMAPLLLCLPVLWAHRPRRVDS